MENAILHFNGNARPLPVCFLIAKIRTEQAKEREQRPKEAENIFLKKWAKQRNTTTGYTKVGQ